MNEQMKKDYENAMEFWNKALTSAPEDYEGEVDIANDWKQIGSESLLQLLCDEGKDWNNILDYGCGSGWASVVFAKNGAVNVLGVDVVPNAIESAGYYVKTFQETEHIKLKTVSTNWLKEQSENQFEHALSMNVLDVVPDEVAKDIICDLSKVCKKGATLLIGMNPCFEGEELTKDGCTYKDHYLFVNDILRVNNHTDEEWSKLFSAYFKVERVEHFKWDGEPKERRRLFYLSNKK